MGGEKGSTRSRFQGYFGHIPCYIFFFLFTDFIKEARCRVKTLQTTVHSESAKLPQGCIC